MEHKNTLVSLVAVFALFMIMSSVSAFAQITNVEVSGVDTASSTSIAAFAGQTLPVRVVFYATGNESDVRVKAWISGDRDYMVSSDRFDVLAGGTYSKLMNIQMPTHIDPSEELNLEVTLESPRTGIVAHRKVKVAAQRESYVVEILDVLMDSKVQAGLAMPLDIVLKNRGRHDVVDAFVKVSVPALGIEQRAYFGDLSPVDQSHPDKQDATERRMIVNIPANAPAGLYAIDIEATSDDGATQTISKKFAVVGAQGTSMVVSAAASKTVAIGDKADYTLTLVNSGNNVRLYELNIDAPTGLTVEADQPFVAIPAGTSTTIKIAATAATAGKYPFTVGVYSDGNLVEKKSFTQTVEGKSKGIVSTTSGNTVNTTVVLTIVLAIIFVVLLVVLIVLLTRKPQKSEELGESYY